MTFSIHVHVMRRVVLLVLGLVCSWLSIESSLFADGKAQGWSKPAEGPHKSKTMMDRTLSDLLH